MFKYFVLAAASLSLSAAQAEQITFTFEGRGSGEIDGAVFDDAHFTITAIGNLDDRVSFRNGYSLQHQQAMIEIDTVGAFEFLIPTRTFVNNAVTRVGFSRGSGPDLFYGPSDDLFATWDMTDDIGPVTDNTGELLQWSTISTSGGPLSFEDETGIATTFAAVIPSPSAASFATLCAVAVLRRSRRR